MGEGTDGEVVDTGARVVGGLIQCEPARGLEFRVRGGGVAALAWTALAEDDRAAQALLPA